MDNRIEYRLLTVDFKDRVKQFLMDYYSNQEPHLVYLKMSNADTERVYDNTLNDVFQHENENVSFLALDMDRNEEVVGVRLSGITDSSDPMQIPLFEHGSENLNKMDAFINVLREDWSQRTPDCRKILQFRILCVRPDYQRRGIAKKLCTMSMDRGRSLGCTHVGTAAVASKSQKLFLSMGFESVNELKHENFKLNGKIVFPTLDDGTDRGLWLVKRL